MSKLSRRSFLGKSAALPAGLGASLLASEAGAHATGGPADTIVTGGTVLTMDPNFPNVEAIAVRARVTARGIHLEERLPIRL